MNFTDEFYEVMRKDIENLTSNLSAHDLNQDELHK